MTSGSKNGGPPAWSRTGDGQRRTKLGEGDANCFRKKNESFYDYCPTFSVESVHLFPEGRVWAPEGELSLQIPK